MTRRTLSPDWEKAGLDKEAEPVFKKATSLVGTAFIGLHPGVIEVERPIQHFITGSSYEGSWNVLGFSGYGTYYFPHGAVYQGHFKNGQFHGTGHIVYPMGHKLRGVWKHGKLIKKKFLFPDDLNYSEPWKYCQMPDRRFQIEVNTSLKGPGEEYQTNKQPTVEIPKNCYDAIDGFYDPRVKCIFNYDEEALKSGDLSKHKKNVDTLKRTVRVDEGQYIEKHFRGTHLKEIGYRPDLYEYWMTGKFAEIRKQMSSLDLGDMANPSGTTLTPYSNAPSRDDIEVQFEFQILNTR